HRRKDSCELYAPNARVLVVDDNELNLKVARSLLGLFGIEPQLAHSGYEAIELIKQDRYTIVLLDHMMPELDGIETLKILRSDRLLPEDTVVIALSANAISGAKESYLKAGFDDYLSKPIDLHALEHTLIKYLPKEYILKRTDPDVQNTPAAGSTPFLERLPEGIGTADGLRYCMNDIGFYMEMLGEYASAAGEKAAKLTELLESGNTEDYRILVHSLKSNSKTLGAADIASQAESLEAAAARGDTEFLKANNTRLCGDLRRIAEEITGALEANDS
ncbi:MAG: response regulator, partial [Ruminococcus sp.]|nr:response regulator [Ruminococcus sp.]